MQFLGSRSKTILNILSGLRRKACHYNVHEFFGSCRRIDSTGHEKLSSILVQLAQSINHVISWPEEFPFFTGGIIYLVFKKHTMQDPAGKSPITRSPTLYELITSIISESTSIQLLTNDNF